MTGVAGPPPGRGAGGDGVPLCVLAGVAGAGKTSFARAFARYLGLRWDGPETGCLLLPPGCLGGSGKPVAAGGGRGGSGAAGFGARGPGAGRAGAGERGLLLVDAAPLYDGIAEDPAVRAAAAGTVRLLLGAAVVLQVVDAAAVGAGAPVPAADRAVAAFASGRGLRRAVLASKADRPLARIGQARLEADLAPARVIPVSARTGRGLREVRAFLAGELA